VLRCGSMTPPLCVPAAALEPVARAFPGTDPEVLQAATARMNALGIDGKAVLVTRDPKEMMAFLGVEEDACATSS
jgi:hypothetical protein